MTKLEQSTIEFRSLIMTAIAATAEGGRTYPRAAWLSIGSGIAGFISLASLLAYLVTQADEFMKTGVMPPVGKILITTNYVGYALQAVLMIPVALLLHDLGRQRSPQVSRVSVAIGIVALLGMAIMRVLPVAYPAVSDILFMAPMGFFGIWLIAFSWLLKGRLSRGLRITGTIAGTGFAIVGASFFFLGGLAVLTDGPFAYANDEDFHVGIRIGGFPAFVLFPIWTILLGRQ